jgi:hypothetical protein
MKLYSILLQIILSGICLMVSAQADSSAGNSPSHHSYTHRDTMYMIRLNHNGNMMIAGGVGLLGAAGYLFYQGPAVYSSPAAPNSTDPAGDITRNHTQGALYLTAAGVATIGGAVLIAFGARNKIDFKRRKRIMSLQAGLLDNGNLGAALTF